MQTLKADGRRRVMLPGAKPGQLLAYRETKDGSFVLTPVEKADPDMTEAIGEVWEQLGPPPEVDWSHVEPR